MNVEHEIYADISYPKKQIMVQLDPGKSLSSQINNILKEHVGKLIIYVLHRSIFYEIQTKDSNWNIISKGSLMSDAKYSSTSSNSSNLPRT